jgi:outer membrane protein assembly factor BamB
MRYVLSVAAFTFLLPLSATAQWPGWRGPERNGRSADTGLLRQWPEDGPPLAWKAEDIGHGWSIVAVADRTIYTTGDEDEELKITALTLAGERQWQVKHDAAWTGPHPGSRATPTIDGKRLYLLSGNGVVGCRRVGDGSLIWERRLQEFGGKVPHWGYSASVLIHDELAIVVPGGDQCVVALDKLTGKKRWATRGYSAGAEYCSPILISHPTGGFLVAATKSGLLGVDVADGSVLWTNSYSTGSGINAATPVYADGHVFWPNGFTKGAVCLKIADDRSVKQVWQTDVDRECHLGDFVADEGYLYGHHDRAWKCFEIATGKELWASDALGTGAVCYADGMLYLFQERRGIAALGTCSPEELDFRGRVQVEGDGPSWAHPVVADGRLYLRYGTTLYCYDVSSRL